MLRFFIGMPGSGKTTLSCKLALQNGRKRDLKGRKLYDRTYLNFRNTVPDCGSADLDGLGQWTFKRRSYVGGDESGIEYNNRAFGSFPKYAIQWYKKRRHYDVDMDLFSQYLDIDVTLLRLVDETWLLYRIGPWTLARYCPRVLRPDKETGEFKFFYSFSSAWWLVFWFLQLGFPFRKRWTLTFRPFYYKYFDSWECDDLPLKDFPVYNKSKRFDYSSVLPYTFDPDEKSQG